MDIRMDKKIKNLMTLKLKNINFIKLKAPI